MRSQAFKPVVSNSLDLLKKIIEGHIKKIKYFAVFKTHYLEIYTLQLICYNKGSLVYSQVKNTILKNFYLKN